MNFVKREKWTEVEIDALPSGEHDFFERKSGLLFGDIGQLLGKLAKTISAMSNSGGGYIILGVDDSGTPDGVPPMQGNTPTRDWLEQKLPHLVSYPLSDFRVHVVERAIPSRIPDNREVIIIDVGDSALAPHQCLHGGGDARKYTYYYRQSGRSEPAPHFYLELLRQRLTNPALEVNEIEIAPVKTRRIDNTIFLANVFRFYLENVGKVTAYKWAIRWINMDGHLEQRVEDYRFGKNNFPDGMRNNIRLRGDDTILPGGLFIDEIDWGFFLRPHNESPEAVKTEIETLILPVTLGYRLLTETSPGELKHIKLQNIVNIEELADFVLKNANLSQGE